MLDRNKKIRFVINNFVVKLKRELEKEFEAQYEKNKDHVAVQDRDGTDHHKPGDHHGHDPGHDHRHSGGNVVIVDVETAEATFMVERKKEIIHEVTEHIMKIDLFDKSKFRFRRTALIPLKTKR